MARRKSKVKRKQLTTTLEEDLLQKAKMLGGLTDKDTNEMLEEGLRLLLAKYQEEVRTLERVRQSMIAG